MTPSHVYAKFLASQGLDTVVKTSYLYIMSSRLVNVRLDADRLRKAQTLRARGMALSDVVREAIDERFAALSEAGRGRRETGQGPHPPHGGANRMTSTFEGVA